MRSNFGIICWSQQLIYAAAEMTWASSISPTVVSTSLFSVSMAHSFWCEEKLRMRSDGIQILLWKISSSALKYFRVTYKFETSGRNADFNRLGLAAITEGGYQALLGNSLRWQLQTSVSNVGDGSLECGACLVSWAKYPAFSGAEQVSRILLCQCTWLHIRSSLFDNFSVIGRRYGAQVPYWAYIFMTICSAADLFSLLFACFLQVSDTA